MAEVPRFVLGEDDYFPRALREPLEHDENVSRADMRRNETHGRRDQGQRLLFS